MPLLRSAAETGLGASNWLLGAAVSHGDIISSESGSTSGEGDGRERSFMKLNGALWGRGDISIGSGPYPGDEEGIGGVVTPSHRSGGVVIPSLVSRD
jgi:hypothetical protein